MVALALSKRSETRYQDGEQFAADLRQIIAGLGGAEPAAPIVTGVASAAGGTAAITAFGPRAAPPAEAGKTLVMAPPPPPSPGGPASATAFDATVIGVPGQGAAAPGYHPAPGNEPATPDAYEKTALFTRPGGGKDDQQA